jgi:riboflavin kinase/FMN adenylyltransferase
VTVVPWADLVDARQRIEQSVKLTIGVFDGLHAGHRELIKVIVEAEKPGGACVITFPRNPQQVLSPSQFPGLILSYGQKLSRLEELGVDTVVAIDFSHEMSNLSGRAFISLLRDNLNIEKIVVGENFRFGRSREAGPGDLREMLFDTGIQVQVSQPVLRDNTIVSSSRIRKTIQEADFAEARAMLLADYAIDLRGIPGVERDTATILYERPFIEQVLPRRGRYRVLCESGGKRRDAELEVFDDCILLTRDCRDQVTTVTFY